MRCRVCLAAALAAVALLGLGPGAPAVASAQVGALLPATGGSAQIPQQARAEVRDAIVSALQSEEWTLLEEADVRARLGPELASCAPGQECVLAAVATLEADAVVGVSIRGTEAHPELPAEIGVQITGIDGLSYEGTALVGTSVRSAARTALREALSRRALGAGPFLTVRGTPGAVIEVDGEQVGTIPATVRVAPGSHQVRVSQQGFAAHEEQVEIEADALATTSLEVQLEAVEGAAGGPGGGGGVGHEPAATRQEPDLLANVSIGAIAAAVGVALLISPIHTLARLGECEDDPPNPLGCYESEVTFGAQSGVLLGLGAAALVTGVIFLAAQPLQVSVQAGPSSGRIQLRSRF